MLRRKSILVNFAFCSVYNNIMYYTYIHILTHDQYEIIGYYKLHIFWYLQYEYISILILFLCKIIIYFQTPYLFIEKATYSLLYLTKRYCEEKKNHIFIYPVRYEKGIILLISFAIYHYCTISSLRWKLLEKRINFLLLRYKNKHSGCFIATLFAFHSRSLSHIDEKKYVRNDVTMCVIYVNRTDTMQQRPITSQEPYVEHLFSLVEQMAMITANDSHQFTVHSCGQKLSVFVYVCLCVYMYDREEPAWRH